MEDFADLYRISPEEVYGPETPVIDDEPFFAEYDEETAMYCVFNQNGKAVSSWASFGQAKADADKRNGVVYDEEPDLFDEAKEWEKHCDYQHFLRHGNDPWWAQ